MAIDIVAATLLLRLRESEKFPWEGGAILQLGKQRIYESAKVLVADSSSSPKSGMTSNEKFFRNLGFESSTSLDVSDYENADLILDLNYPLSAVAFKQYDVVYDGGTVEHVFDVPEALKNIFKLTKVGGLIVHHVVANQNVDHGYYQFSPCLFHDFYSINNFEIIQTYYVITTFKKNYVFEYDSFSDANGWRTNFGKHHLTVWFVARKIESSTCEVVPMQGAVVKDHKRSESKICEKVTTESGSGLRHLKLSDQSVRILLQILWLPLYFRRSIRARYSHFRRRSWSGNRRQLKLVMKVNN